MKISAPIAELYAATRTSRTWRSRSTMAIAKFADHLPLERQVRQQSVANSSLQRDP